MSDHGTAPRARRDAEIRPAAEPAIAPALVSDASAPAVVGLTPLQFRRALREHGVAHCKIGRRTLARVEDVVALVDRLSGRVTAAMTEDEVVALARRAR
jgi:hypothetical protein